MQSIEASYVSTVPGVTVWGGIRIRRLRKRRARRITARNAITESVESMLEEAQVHSDDQQPEVGAEEVHLFFECEKCGTHYRKKEFLEAHIEKCTGGSKRDILSRSTSIAMELLVSSEIGLYTTKQINPILENVVVYEEVVSFCARKEGWAARPAYGQTLRTNKVFKYRADLMEWFTQGSVDNARKMSASQMREALKSKYPRTYDFPDEHFITRFISAQFYAQKKVGKANTLSASDLLSTAGMPARRRGVATPYAEAISSLLEGNDASMPRHIKHLVIGKMGMNSSNLPEDFPNDQTLKNRLSSLKSALRNARR